MSRRNTQLAVALLIVNVIATDVIACLACYRPPYQSLLEKVEASDQVVVARTLAEARDRWQGKVVRVIKGNDVAVDQMVVVEKPQPARIAAGDAHLLRQSIVDGSWTIEAPGDRELLRFPPA